MEIVRSFGEETDIFKQIKYFEDNKYEFIDGHQESSESKYVTLLVMDDSFNKNDFEYYHELGFYVQITDTIGIDLQSCDCHWYAFYDLDGKCIESEGELFPKDTPLPGDYYGEFVMAKHLLKHEMYTVYYQNKKECFKTHKQTMKFVVKENLKVYKVVAPLEGVKDDGEWTIFEEKTNYSPICYLSFSNEKYAKDALDTLKEIVGRYVLNEKGNEFTAKIRSGVYLWKIVHIQ